MFSLLLKELIFEFYLTLKSKKCRFRVPEVTYLGHVLSKEGIKKDPANVQKIKDFPKPRNVKEVQSMIGLFNYYKRFIKGFSHLIKPITSLLKKDTEFVCSLECENAFLQLKHALTSSVTLAYPDFSKGFILACDASGHASGYVISQLDDNNRERPIAFSGRCLRPNELKWSTTEKECLAVLEGIKAFHVYLAGKKFKIKTDHQALQCLRQIK